MVGFDVCMCFPVNIWLSLAAPVYSNRALSEPPCGRLNTGVRLRTGAVEVLLMRRRTSQEPTRSMGT